MAAEEKVKSEDANENKQGGAAKKGNQHWKGKAAKKIFEGECAALKGHVYHVFSNQVEQFLTTNKHLAVYVGQTMKHGGDMREMVINLEMPFFDPIPEPDANAGTQAMRRFDKLCDEQTKRECVLDSNNKQLYALVWGQCTEAMRERIEAQPSYMEVSSSSNGLRLLRLIRTIVYNYNTQKEKGHSLWDAIFRITHLRQGSADPTGTDSLTNHLTRVKNHRDVLEQMGGNISLQPSMHLDALREATGNETITLDEASEEEYEAAASAAKERFMARVFMLTSDRVRYGKLILELENGYGRGQDVYPHTLTDAYRMLSTYKNPDARSGFARGEGAVAFTNIGEYDDEDTESHEAYMHANIGVGNRQGRGGRGGGRAGGRSGRGGGRGNRNNITCFNCNTKGHYSWECTGDNGGNTNTNATGDAVAAAAPPATGTSTVNQNIELETTANTTIGDDGYMSDESYEFHFHQMHTSEETCLLNKSHRNVSNFWILLDNQSTIDVFCNRKLLKNIRSSESRMKIHCNAGITEVTMVGDLQGYGTVWFNPTGIANILSMSRVIERGYKVEFSSLNGNEFIVTHNDGSQRIFKASVQGLYYLDASPTAVLHINTVEDNKNKYTNRDYTRAIVAREFQQTIGRPSTRDLIHIIENNIIPNCPVTKRDVRIAEDIFGPDLGSLKGKTVRKCPIPVEVDIIDLPSSVMTAYKDVTLAADCMFVNRQGFLVTISRHIKFSTTEALINQKQETLLAAIKRVQAIYTKRGFRITNILMDGQFEVLRGDLASLGITLNVVSQDEHVPDVERYIRTLKERIRSVYTVLPFAQIPLRMLIELVYSATFWLNSLPAHGGISATLSPRGIVVGTQVDFNRHCRLQYGAYVQTHEAHDNSLLSRTTGALAMRPTGNVQGGYYFYSLTSGRIINRSRWTTLPMPNEVIARVLALARRDRAGPGALRILDRNGHAVDPDNDAALDDPAGVDIAGVDDGNAGLLDDHDAQDDDPEPHLGPDLGVDMHDHDDDANDGDNVPPPAPHDIDAPDPDDLDNHDDDMVDKLDTPDIVATPPEIVDLTTDADTDDVVAQMDEKYGPRAHTYNLRPRKPATYSHLHLNVGDHFIAADLAALTSDDQVHTQLGLKAGLKAFGSAGTDAVMSELKMLHVRKVIRPVDANTLSALEKHRALRYLMFLKEKKNGIIKGRGCADGRPQKLYVKKEDAASPTVATESVMLSSTIDAYERRDVATVDVPNAFMQTPMDEIVYMKLEGFMVECLLQIDRECYEPFIIEENGQMVLYVILEKALYGTVKAALYFWKRLSSQLQQWGFTINPYDPCVANKMYEGSQCTIIWHVDDIKISHINPMVVSTIIELLQQEFGKETPLTVNRGKKHDYLGMQLDYSHDGKVQISMFKYIQEILDEAPEDMDGTVSTPASPHLFETNQDNPTMLDDAESVLFHHLVAKLLFLAKRSRPDIQTAVAFLCTRVKAPDTDDYKKLGRVVRYLRGTLNIPLTLEADGMSLAKWWIDASFATHGDMRSHTGGAFSLGNGVIYGTSTKQKLNTKSSTEAELVGVSDTIPQILWTRLFLQAQGYKSTESIIYQDNKSAILLEKNGKMSSSKRTRHLNIRYFFVTDHVDKGDVKIEYCPTERMLGDYFTKPLQGTRFRQFRDFILNFDPAISMDTDHRSVLETENVNEIQTPDTNDGWTTVTHKRKKIRMDTNPKLESNEQIRSSLVNST